MKLCSLLGLSRGDMISIVGAGGKTTLMFTLAEELRKNYKCLVTTTTKIFMPDRKYYDFSAIGIDNFQKIKECCENGIYIFGSSINEEKKLVGISTEILDKEFPHFDFVLIEADGSKRKPVKGWNDNEPVISSRSNKTIGVVSIEAIGKEINDSNVHRVKEFMKITGTEENGVIQIEDIVRLIFHPMGLFKNSSGERILFVNKVENKEHGFLVEELMHYINNRNKTEKLIDKIIIGSLKNKEYSIV